MVELTEPQEEAKIMSTEARLRLQIETEVRQGSAKLKNLLILKSYIHNWNTLFQGLREHLSNLEDAALEQMWLPVEDGGLGISRTVLRDDLKWRKRGQDDFDLYYTDQSQVDHWIGSIKYDEEKNGKLCFKNKGRIPKKALLLGGSSKQNDINLIGKFGEGFKVANLLLLRLKKPNGEDDCKPSKIYNGLIEWEFLLLEDKDVDDLVCLHYVERVRPQPVDANEVIVEIKNIMKDEWREIWKTKFLALTDLPIQRLKSPATYSQNKKMLLGEILYHPDMVGKVFNQGIYVCDDSKMRHFGVNYYNLTLNRDRTSVQDPYERNIMFSELVIDICHNYDSREYAVPKARFFQDIFNSLLVCSDNDILSTFYIHTQKPIYKAVCNQLYSIYLQDFCTGLDGVIDQEKYPNYIEHQVSIENKLKVHGLQAEFYRSNWFPHGYFLKPLWQADGYRSVEKRIFEVLETAPDIEINQDLVQQKQQAIQWIQRVYNGIIPEIQFRNFDPKNRQYRYLKGNILYLSSLIILQPKSGLNSVCMEIFIQIAEVVCPSPINFVNLF